MQPSPTLPWSVRRKIFIVPPYLGQYVRRYSPSDYFPCHPDTLWLRPRTARRNPSHRRNRILYPQLPSSRSLLLSSQVRRNYPPHCSAAALLLRRCSNPAPLPPLHPRHRGCTHSRTSTSGSCVASSSRTSLAAWASTRTPDKRLQLRRFPKPSRCSSPSTGPILPAVATLPHLSPAQPLVRSVARRRPSLAGVRARPRGAASSLTGSARKLGRVAPPPR